MKAKACTRCRQSKLRCDSDVKSPAPCSRCEGLSKACIFDRSFQSTSKTRKLLDLEAEVLRLRRAAESRQDASPTARPASVQSSGHESQMPAGICLRDKTIGNVRLTAAQVTELFRAFFAQCHQYLPFSMQEAPETVYEKSELLFWVICAVTSSPSKLLELKPHVQGQVGQIVVNPPRSVEVVQALLILCMWPFPFHSTLGDPSFLYSGLAVHISLQIGLHRPDLPHEFSSRKQVLEVSDEVRRTTWMACYVVSQMQGGRLGVPASVKAEHSFLHTLDVTNESDPLIDLCRISRLVAQFTTTIGANARNQSGLMDSITRIELVTFFSLELDSLREKYLTEASPAVQVAYLTAKLQLWSFILHDDIPSSQDVIEFYYRAEKDATAMIQLASERNLSRCPFHLVRGVLYSALVLIKILALPYASQHKVLYDQVHLASRCLSSAVKVEDDHAQRWSKHLLKLLTLQDLKRTPAIRSRLAAAPVYDAIRVMKEHLDEISTDLTMGQNDPLVPSWSELDFAPGCFDLDGINWDEFEGLF